MKQFIYEEENTVRLDVFLSDQLEDISRAEIQRLIKSGDILVNNEKSKPSYRLELNDEISVSEIIEEEFEITPIDYPIEIVYEDDYLLVVNKPKNLVVYPGAGRENDSLVAALLGMNIQLYESEEKERPGIVHRLDKDTSGLIVLSKDEKTHTELLKMFKERSITRKYLALVDGVIVHDYGTIDAPIGRDESNRTKMSVSGSGREAKTLFTVKEKYKDFTLVECELVSGRTHQIRVHMQYIKHPIIGDMIYRKKTKVKSDSLMLQSYYLEFNHPITHELLKFELEMRDDFKQTISDWSNV